jgi:transposase-like protein
MVGQDLYCLRGASVGRPPKHPVDVKLKIVLSVLSGESSQAEAARRHGFSETSIGKWKEQFLLGGRQGLEHGHSAGRPTGPRRGWPRRLTT